MGPSLRSSIWKEASAKEFFSLYIFFVLCMKHLGQIIDGVVASKRWRPIKLSRGDPNMSHIFFHRLKEAQHLEIKEVCFYKKNQVFVVPFVFDD